MRPLSGLLLIGALVAGSATPAAAISFNVEAEAWPVQSSQTCPDPCYQVRVFLEDVFASYQPSAIQYLLLDIDVRYGAQPAVLPVPPAANANAGPGTLRVRLPGGATQSLPWNLSSTVGRSPSSGYDVLMVHAADAPFTVRSLAERLGAEGVECLDDPSKCEFVTEASELDRIYLGFFNVTRTDALIGNGEGAYTCGDPMSEDTFCTPPAGPYFVMRVGHAIESDVEGLAGISVHGIPVPYLPEPGGGPLLAVALGAVALLRRSGALARAR